eukprot:CAMPEP_0206392574 /NCGR_PEP_ID=MMETSP0294-20121207/20064_1 /ASSEMBLY_ACC=CAM_ASM_000327 /TAXON_ID=39354 /ORGANISM="Heterosigma akashiwo, Strain CCMP2393" /LENGTH=280 /DNA_ID=CAMNT_0053845727 /DNA_START=72 /DNA_END=914 /DNA_ORIENTATION=-
MAQLTFGNHPLSAPPPPDLAAAHTQSSSCAQLSECAICFENLFKHQTAAFKKSSQRTCRHFFHAECIEPLLQDRSREPRCPLCNASVDAIMTIPNPLEDPEGWFIAVDLDGNGELDQTEVCDVLEAQLPVDGKKLREEIHNCWSIWDPNGSGRIDRRELLGDNGLMRFAQANWPFQRERPPDIRTAPMAWFNFWDDDNSHNLDKDEVARALVRTFAAGSGGGGGAATGGAVELARLRALRETVDAVWPLFDEDGNGTISAEEFCRENGLGETIVAQIRFS